MRRAARWAIAAAVLAALSRAAVPGQPPVPVELPFGPVVRPGRPLVVRAPGAAAVRAEGGPWAFAGGEAGDEFLLIPPPAVTRSLDLTIRVLGAEDLPEGDREPQRARFDVRVLPADGTARAVFDPREAAAPTDVPVHVATLPTVPEAWLLFDEVPPVPPGASAGSRRAIQVARDLPRPGDPARAPFQPWTSGPDAAAYRALAAVAAATPSLPRDVAAALCVLAAAELVLLLVLRRRRPWVRAAWIAAPPLAAFAGLWAAGRTAPAPIRAVAVRLQGPADTLVVVRLEGPRAGASATGSFEVPPDGASPAVVAFDAGDADDAHDGVAVRGRRVEVTLGPGQSRVLAWRAPRAAPGGDREEDATDGRTAEVRAWIRERGLDVVPGASAAPPSAGALDGIRLRELPPIRVAARK